jgi:hypothetical protein
VTSSPPPIYEPLAEQDGKARLPWILFFNEVFSGDAGSPSSGAGAWNPAFVNLTQVGVPSITGKYYRDGRFIDFWVKIVASTSTSSTAGTTYIEALPFTVTTDAPCFATNGTTGIASGVVQASTNRIYVPTWSLITTPLTITGRVEAF